VAARGPASSLAKIRVLIVDDHPVVRVGLKAMVDAQPDMEAVGEVGDGRAAIEVFGRQSPDVTLVDLRMPGMSGPEVIAELRGISPQAQIIALTSYDGDEDVFRAVQAGARGYLLKGTHPEQVLDAIRRVHAGESGIAPEVAGRLAERVSGPALSPREIEVLALVAQGKSNKEIAVVLFLAEDTVKNHLKSVYAKLGVNDRAGAAMVAVQRGILTIGR
jgi:two-component system, NarL family, response regulator